MGSSVFHGGFSTFIALSVLAPSKTYVLVVFYRTWTGIILFGMANGFFLLPVILSFIGPTETVFDPSLLQIEAEKETNYDFPTVLSENEVKSSSDSSNQPSISEAIEFSEGNDEVDIQKRKPCQEKERKVPLLASST